MRATIIFSFLLLALISNGQENLVQNPSFEEYIDCPQQHTPENSTTTLVPHWTFPNKTASDYFNKCSKLGAGVPSNFAGKSNAFDGVGYAGAILSGSTFSHREYLQGELKKPMKNGVKYCISFRYKLASGSRFAIDQIGLYLSKEKLAKNTKEELKVEPQLKNPVGIFLDNTKKWEQFCRVYTAEGGEQFLTIGNFHSYMETNYVGISKSATGHAQTDYAYYYFDMVEIYELTDCELCACTPHDLKVAVIDSFYTGGYNPITSEIDRNPNDGRIKLSIEGGTLPYTIQWSNGAKTKELKNLKAGTYTYSVYDALNCNKSGKIIFKAPEVQQKEVEDDLFSIREGTAIVLNNIFFETGKTALLPESNIELDKVARFIIDNKIQKIEISGHTDNIGNEAYNQKLSEGRAKSVVDYLISKGVKPDVLDFKGYGITRPVDTNLTKEGQANNRRVEFFLVKK